MAVLTSRLSERAANDLAEALWSAGVIGRETSPKVRELAKLGAGEEGGPDFELDHLVVLARVLHDYEWSDPAVYAALQAEVTQLLTV